MAVTIKGFGSDWSVPAPARKALGEIYATKAETVTAEADKFSALAPWHAALANRDNEPARWYALGDSITEGANATSRDTRWVQKSLRTLRRRFPTAGPEGGGTGFIPPYYDGSTMGQPYDTYGGSIAKNTVWGIGRRGASMSAGAFYEYTVNGTSLLVNYAQTTSAGTMTVTIDDGEPATINLNGDHLDGQTWASGPLAPGAHVVRIDSVTGTNPFTGLTVFNGDENKGIQLYEGGHFGAASDWWVTSGSGHWAGTFTAVRPHLVTISLMTNDYSRDVSPATSKASIQTIIQWARQRVLVGLEPGATHPMSFLITMYPKRGNVTSPAHTWEEYVAVAREIADADPGVAFLDLSEKVEDAVDNTLGLWDTDRIHPTDKGHALIADHFVGYAAL